jgi:Arc/MetJ family transcription regulator
MKRTQLYLDEDLWTILHSRARSEKTTVSELVRVAVRERYLENHAERMKAMQAFVGSRRRSSDSVDATEIVRSLRSGSRIDRLNAR